MTLLHALLVSTPKFGVHDRSATDRSWAHAAMLRHVHFLSRRTQSGISGIQFRNGHFQFLAKQKEKQDAQRICLLTIWFGCNDACLSGSPQHVPLTTFAANLTTLIQMVRSPESPYYSPITKIILINPPPINSFQLPRLAR